MLTTLCAMCLGGMLGRHITFEGLDAWALAFLLLASLHALMVVSAISLPRHCTYYPE